MQTVDECLGQVVDAVHAAGGACLITADHGNAEQMLQADGSTSTAHSVNPVPLIVTARGVDLRPPERSPTSPPPSCRCWACSRRTR